MHLQSAFDEAKTSCWEVCLQRANHDILFNISILQNQYFLHKLRDDLMNIIYIWFLEQIFQLIHLPFSAMLSFQFDS